MATENGQSRVDPQTGELVSIEEMQTVPGNALPGSEEQLSFDLGSQFSLSESTLKLGTIPALSVDGQFHEGDRVRVILDIEVEYVSFPPIRDRGFRVGTERRHFGQVLSAVPADE